MATTSSVSVSVGSGKNLATNSFSEDAITKELSRVVLNNSSGIEQGGLSMPVYDYVAYTNTNTTTDTYVFKSGGSGGTSVATLTIVFTDTSKSQISTVTKT